MWYAGRMEKSHGWGLNRWGAAGLVFLVGAQSVLANQPEKNYWDQRRADRSAHRSGTLVSRAGPPRSSLLWGDSLPPVQAFRPSLSPSLERAVPKNFIEKHRALLNALSPIYGTVRKVTPAPGFAAGRVVVHIQDVHHNAEAQSNIRGAVADLLKSGRVGVVALEGSSEPIDLQAFADFPHRQPVELAADWLLKENKISGPIHAALTFQGRLPRLVGVDDEKHYAANVQAVRDAARQAGGVRHTIEIARRKLEVDKSRVFSADLSALDKTVNDYRAERIPLGAYVETLTARASAGGRAFRSVDLFLKALKIERSLDFQQVERERKKLLEKLTQTLTDPEIETLMAESAAYRSGGRLFGEFYAGLTDLCRRKGVALSAFPAMDEYVRYALMADGIQSEQLLTEIGLLEKAAYDAVVRMPEERALVDRSRRLWLASRLADFALTPGEWDEWVAKGQKKHNEVGGLASFEAFYREAQARDGAMANNVVNALADSDVAVLVTGGFHAEGVARLLEQRGVSVISFVPKLTKVDLAQGSGYLSVFSQEKTPLEKLFQGEKLFLSTPPIAKEIRRIQLPVVVTLLGVLLATQIDPQLTYALLGGLGQIKDVVVGVGLAQGLVVVGAGALVFRVFNKGGKVDVVSSPERPGFATTFKIKLWDPVREQVLYFFPVVVLVPSLFAWLVITAVGGGVGMFLAVATFLVVSVSGVFGVVVILLGFEHKRYAQKQREALVGPALKIGVLTLAGFVVSMVLLSPSVMGLVSYTDQFFSWMPAGEWKAFFLSALAGNLLGVWKLFDHNEKTFENFLKWQSNGNSFGLMPLSISGARSKLKVRPAFSKTPIKFPNNVDRPRMLKAFEGAARSALMGNTADPIAVKTLINGIVEYNPSFAKANKPLLDDTVRLSQNPALLQRIIFAAIFAPLGAFSLDFNSAIDIDHSSWEGFHYLGDKIWLVSPLEGLRHESLNMFFGVGLKPTIDYVAFGANVIKLFLKKRPENMDATERNNAIQWAQIMGQAYEQRNRWILMQMLKDYTFYRRRSHEEGFPPEPFARDVAMVITKNNSRFSWDKYSRTAPAFVNARLSGWIQGLVFLLENDNPYLGHLFTKAQLHSISLERQNNGGPMDALGDIMGTVDFSPVEDLIRKRDDKRAIQKAISLIKALQDENFLTFEERHQIVYGKLPGNRPEHAIVTKDGADSLAVIPQAPTQEAKPLVSQTLSPGAPISLPQASPSAATENSMPDTGEVVNAQSPPPLLGPLESLETIGQIRGAIATLNDADRRGDSDMGLETIQELRVRLLQMVRESDNPAAELKTNGEALGLNSDEKLFLERYLEQQKKGLNPSFGYVVDGMNDDGEQNMLDAYARLVNLVGKVDYLPLSFDEDVEDVSDAEMSEGGLSPFYSKGYRVVVYKEHFEKNVANNNLVQKAIVNVVGNLVNRRETGESDMVIDSRGGLYARGVHKKTSSGQKVFIKIVGEKTIVVFWVGSEDKAHGRQSFTANKEVDRRIASQVENLPNELDKYVAVGADFSVDSTADLSKLLQNPQTGNGGGPSGAKSNSLLYLVSGRPGLGIGGAGVEAIFLLLGTSILGGVGMGFFLLPLFSLAHVWIIARQNPGMSVAQLVQQFVWHYLLALPYALIGFSSVQEILGGENAAQFFAASWHLLTDAVFMIHDKISARKAAQRTMDTLLPPAGSLRIEQVGGARWTQDVRPQLFRPGFARAYEKALARELSQRWRGSLTTSPDGLVEWLESSFSGTPATADGQKVYVQAVAGEDLDDVLRSAQIVNGWVDRGLDAPRLVLAAKDTAVLAKLRAVARPGVVDVVEKPVTDPKGALDAALLLDSLNRFQISPSARLSVMVSASISVNEAVLDQLNGDLADQLREALLAIIKGDPIRHRDFRTVLEVATKVLESA